MGNLAIGLKQIYGGVKTIFGRGGKKAAQQAVRISKPAYSGPSLIDITKKQPLALPAPTAEQLAAEFPRVCVPKALHGINANELRMSQEILADGTHVRYFRGPGSDRILLKMEDKGLLHKEWINPGGENFTYIKSTGGGDRYILKKDGNFTQIEKRAVKYKDGIDQKISTNDLYYNGHNAGYHQQKTYGFNGEHGDKYEMYGTVEGLTYKDGQRVSKPVQYWIKSDGRFKTNEAPAGKMSLADLYTKEGETAYMNAHLQADDIYKRAKDRFITDFDEALFTPYKNY